MKQLSYKKIKFNDKEISSQKECVPGPNVKFTKGAVSFGEYINNISKGGSLGCNQNQYPKYKIEDGKYCCENEMASPQEQLDYVNMLILKAVENVGETAFVKYTDEIEFLINHREDLLRRNINHELSDTLTQEFPITINNKTYNTLNDYINKNMVQSNNLASDYQTETKKYYGDSKLEELSEEELILEELTSSNTNVNKKRKKVGGKSYRKTLKCQMSKKARRKSHRKNHRGYHRRSKK